MTGRSVLNGFHAPDFPFKNLFKMSSGAWSAAFAGVCDANGYPTSNSFTSPNATIIFPSLYHGRYRITWTGSARFQIPFCATIYDGGAAVIGLGANTGFIANNATIDGTISSSTPNGYVEFDFSAAVSGAVDNGSGAIRLTIPSGMNTPSTGSACFVAGVGGVSNAAGQWTFTKVDSTHIDLIGPTFAGAYTSGGTVTFEPQSFNCPILSTGTFSGFTDIILCRSTAPYANDLTDIKTGDLSKCFNADFLTVLTTLNPSILRPLDASGINGSTISRSSYITTVSSISYNAVRYPPSTWAGTISGTNAFTCSSYPDMPGSWTDGETFQGTITNAPTTLAITGINNNGGKIQVQVADTSTLSTGQRVNIIGYNGALNGFGNGIWAITVDSGTLFTLTTGPDGNASAYPGAWTSGGTVSTATINVGSRGGKLLANAWGSAPSRFQTISASSIINCTYDALQDCLLVTASSGLSLAWPLAVRVALCNALGMSYWHIFPTLYDTASATADAAYIRDNLGASLSCYFEFGNELWNTNFPQTQLAQRRGATLGWPNANNEQQYGYNALRHRQIMESVTATWGGRGGLKRVFPTFAVNAAGATDRKYLYEGFDLNGTNFPRYGSQGYSNYDTAPNRPIDYTDVLSYAPYYNGAILEIAGVNLSLASYAAGDITGLTGAADNFATGTAANIASAFAWLDNDIRAGTRNSVLGNQTLSYLNSNYYSGFNTACGLYSPAKTIACYESGYQGTWPTTAQCTTLGISTSYGGVGGSIYNLLQAYKKSTSFVLTVDKQWNDQLAITPTLIPSWYTFGQNSGVTANDQFSMIPTDIYSTPYYGSYDAMSLFNNRKRRLIVKT